MNAPRLITVVLLSSLVSVWSQTPGGEPPRRDGERRGPGGPPGMGGGSGMMRPPMGFDKLTEEEKQIMREAFSKAWSNPDVVAARDKAVEANEQARHLLHETMKKDNPKVASILEKMKPPYPVDEHGLPEMPKPESPDFVKMAGLRLGAEAMSRAGRHEDSRRFHDRIMQLPRMKDAFAAMEKAPAAERIESFRKIRELYRQLVGEELARFAKAREEREAAAKGKE